MAEDREQGQEPEPVEPELVEPDSRLESDPAGPEPESELAELPEPADRSESEGEAKAKAKPLPGGGTEDGVRLRAAHRAFEVGDYRRVRALCDTLVEAPDAEVAASARELRARTAIDPVQVGVVLACLVLLALIAYVYVL